MKKVIVTGADGFVGSHLTEYLAKNGNQVYAVVLDDSPSRFRVEGLENVHIVPVHTLSDYKEIEKLLPMNADAFVHLAWAGVSHEKRDSFDIQIENINICLNAVRLAADVCAQRFILPGSTMEYMYSGGEINNTSLPSPDNVYGAAKISARYLCAALCEELKLPYIYVVIAGIYSADRVDNNVIYYAISTLLDGKKPSFTKLEQLWDYVHIDDVVYALSLIIEKGRAGAFYSIGHGDNWPLYNYIYQIRDIIDPNLELGIGEIPYKADKMPCSCIDLTALERDTGYKPRIPFDVGIKSVIDTVRKRRQLQGGL